ncbi:MAG: MarR family transcriptional regulator [Pseudomonadota bacterium]
MTGIDAMLLARRMDRLMRRLNAAFHQRAEPLDTDKVGPLGGMVIMALADLGPTPVSALTAELGRDKSQMTRLIQMLERKGYVVRSSHPEDKRVSVMALTERGEAFTAQMRVILAEVAGDLLGSLSEGERAAFMESLGKI